MTSPAWNMTNLFFYLFLFSFLALFIGLIKPKLFQIIFKKEISRKNIVKIFGSSALLFFILIGLTAPTIPEKQEDNSEMISKEPDVHDDINEQPIKNQNNDQVVDSVTSFLLTSDTEEIFDTTINDQEVTASETEDAVKQTELYIVQSVLDGDTIKISYQGESRSVRLIGIDTPETVHPTKPVECFGIEASNFAHTMLEGKEVLLESDESQGDVDKYGRLLRYIFLSDGTDFNLTMIKEGYAYEYTYSTPYRYQKEYKEAQEEAQTAKRGLWADGACQDTQQEDVNTSNETGNTPDTSTQTSDLSPATSCECSSDSYNCSNFSTHTEAQSVYECCLTQIGYDIHKLDGDDDGQACESLP